MEYTILILLLPLLSFLFLGLAGMKLKPVVAGAIGTAVLAVVALLSYCTAFEYFSAGRDASGVFPTLVPWNTVWLPISRTLHIDLGILLDPISVMMLVVISTVSLMVHVYSLGYMKGERGVQRYYAFLSLFTMSMMGLVVATNIFQMYLFWELVGVSSYLLIGFYYTKKEAVAASKKAFIVTRFADLGFLVGILFYGYYAGTFSFTPDVQLLAAAGAISLGTYFGGGRIMHTLGSKVIDVTPAHGFVAETTSATILYLTAFVWHAPISTTQSVSSAIMGVGATKRLSAVRWGVAGNIAIAWVLTLPGAALIGAISYFLIHAVFPY